MSPHSVRYAATAAFRASLRACAGYKWGLVATVVAFIVYVAVFYTDPYAARPGGDGHYSWLFARSLVFDGDLDFTNDYALCGDPFEKNVLRGTSHPDNPFYPGPALFWVPVLGIARALIAVPEQAAPAVRAACVGTFPRVVLLTTPVIAALALFFAYLAARRFAKDGAAALAVALIGISTPTVTYAAGLGSYSHAYAGFAVALLVWSALRAAEAPSARSYAWVSLFLGLTVFERPQMITFSIIPVAYVATLLGKVSRPRVFALFGLLGGGALLGIVPILVLYKYIYGRIDAIPQGHNYIHFGHTHPLLTLFSPHGGLFQFIPAAWLSVAGALMCLRRRDRLGLTVPLMVAFVIELWVCSAPLDWGGSWSVGARRLLSLNPILILFAAVALEGVTRWLERKPKRTIQAAGVLAALPLCFAGAGGALAYISHDLSAVQPASPETVFGTATRALWRPLSAVDPAILPAEVYFSLRYRLPPANFRSVVETEIWYVRNYATMEFRAASIPTTGPLIEAVSRGFSTTDKGLVLRGAEAGRLVFSAAWPFATALEIGCTGRVGDRLRVGVSGNWPGARWADPVALATDGPQIVRVDLPPRAFDSGLLELSFEREGEPGGELLLRTIRILDENRYRPSLE